MQKHIKILSIAFFILTYTHAQQKDSIGTEVVTIVKPYTPTLSDAFKLRDVPILDTITPEKKTIEYTIFSVPVASTFVPTTGAALSLAPINKESLYNSYVSLALGNYTTALLDFYTRRPLEKDKSLDIALHHHSSQGGISDIVLNDAFYNSSLQLTYNEKSRDLDWKAGAAFQHQRYHWYGIYDTTVFNENTLSSIEEQQNYYDAHINAEVIFRASPFKEVNLSIRRFWDTYGTAEYQMIANPKLEFPIAGERLHLQLNLDYLNGNFDRQYLDEAPLEYSNFIAGISPILSILRDNLKVNLGAEAVYSLNPVTRENNFFIYPQVTASYNIVNSHLIFYGGVEGNLLQNTYRNFVAENPFVSPTLNIAPTNTQYDTYIGIKGKFTPTINYHLKGAYSIENNRALFLLNPIANTANGEAYTYGNSYRILYDDVKTFSVLGEIAVDLYKNLDLNFQTEFFDYQTDNQPEAWNLPNIKASISAKYSPGEHWSGGANIFYVGARKDLLDGEGFAMPQNIDADSYVDINANLAYRFNPRLSTFLKVHNILNNEYTRWATYPVQGFQALVGASYQFNF